MLSLIARLATQKVNTSEIGAEARTSPTVNNGRVPSRSSSHNPPKTASNTMTSVMHPTSPPITANLVPSITAGTRSLSCGLLGGIIAGELYHKDFYIVNKTTLARWDECGLTRPHHPLTNDPQNSIACAAVAARLNHGLNNVPTIKMPATNTPIANRNPPLVCKGTSSPSERYKKTYFITVR